MTKTKAADNPEVFDADAKAQARKDAGLKLGGKLYPRQIRNNKIMRQVRQLGRQQAELAEDLEDASHAELIERLQAQLSDAIKAEEYEPTKIAALRADLRKERAAVDADEVNRLQEELEDTTSDLLQMMLGPAADGTEIDAEGLAEGLDFEDALHLSQNLLAVKKVDAEDEADPT